MVYTLVSVRNSFPDDSPYRFHRFASKLDGQLDHEVIQHILFRDYSTPNFDRPLRKHAYSNMLKILPPENEKFQIKNSDIFFIFLIKTEIVGTH